MKPIERVKLEDLLNRLKREDQELRVFGANYHKYELRPPLDEATVRDFEAVHLIELPTDYRRFLLEVADGGAGPYYGMESLASASSERDASRSWPFDRDTTLYSDAELATHGDWDYYPGILELSHHGCSWYSYLVVNGPTYGMMWEGCDVFYAQDISFSAWYRRWAQMLIEHALPVLERELAVDSIEVGMTQDEVMAILGGEWQVRRFDQKRSFLSCSGLATQFELDPDLVVTRIVKHCIARRL